jgi:hypothetical protein
MSTSKVIHSGMQNVEVLDHICLLGWRWRCLGMTAEVERLYTQYPHLPNILSTIHDPRDTLWIHTETSTSTWGPSQ